MPRVICNNFASETIGFGHENRLTLSLSFQTFLSRLVLGSCETCAETSTKSSSAINRVVWKRCSGYGWGEVLTKFPALSCRRSFSRHCSGGEKRACAGIVKGFIKRRTMFVCIYTGCSVLFKPRLFLNSPMYVTLIYFRFELGKLLCTISVVTLLVWYAHSLCYINFYFQETMTFPTLGLSCFVYLLLVEEMELMNFPAVFR